MKKLILILLCLILTLSGCGGGLNTSSDQTGGTAQVDEFELKGIWMSCYEMSFGGLPAGVFRQEVADRFARIADFGLNAVFVHVRANSDAFYPSELFPWAKQMCAADGTAPYFDPLEIMIEEAHNAGLEFHAWVNPYRVSGSSENVAELPDGSPAKTWLTDDNTANDDWAVQTAGGIYYNPAIPEVQRLIVDGVREIAAYDVDGIHFDDYFYPTTDAQFDAAAYQKYCDSADAPMALSDWRRANVNALISQVHAVAAAKGKVFGISPSADISDDGSDRNYTEQYADIALWMRESGYVDYIAPQLYFGFDYPAADFTYDVLIEEWCALPRSADVRLYIGLAAYKIGTEDAGSEEWMHDSTILAKQTERARRMGCGGIILFSYDSFVNDDFLFASQMMNLREVLMEE